MLQDRVRNKLQVIAGRHARRSDVFRALEEIAQSIDELSDGALANGRTETGAGQARRQA